jgi:hypothetical protein
VVDAKKEVFLLYQMGSSEDWTWYSVIGVFFSEGSLMSYAKEKSILSELRLLETTDGNIILREPVEFVAVRSPEGEVPNVELDRDISSGSAAS